MILLLDSIFESYNILKASHKGDSSAKESSKILDILNKKGIGS